MTASEKSIVLVSRNCHDFCQSDGIRKSYCAGREHCHDSCAVNVRVVDRANKKLGTPPRFSLVEYFGGRNRVAAGRVNEELDTLSGFLWYMSAGESCCSGLSELKTRHTVTILVVYVSGGIVLQRVE